MSVQEFYAEPESFEALMVPFSQNPICVLQGSAYASWLSSSPRYKYIEQVGKPDLDSMRLALMDGECDGIIERNMHLDFLQKLYTEDKLIVSAALRDGPQTLAVQVVIYIYI